MRGKQEIKFLRGCIYKEGCCQIQTFKTKNMNYAENDHWMASLKSVEENSSANLRMLNVDSNSVKRIFYK